VVLFVVAGVVDVVRLFWIAPISCADDKVVVVDSRRRRTSKEEAKDKGVDDLIAVGFSILMCMPAV
jgi:hypothetical protein